MPTLESKIERQFALMVRARGGLAIKMAPTMAGIPDRLVLWPHGGFDLVELKTRTGGLRAIQVHRHAELLKMGHKVVVLRGEADIVEWLDDVTIGTQRGDGHNPNCSPFCRGDHPPA